MVQGGGSLPVREALCEEAAHTGMVSSSRYASLVTFAGIMWCVALTQGLLLPGRRIVAAHCLLSLRSRCLRPLRCSDS